MATPTFVWSDDINRGRSECLGGDGYAYTDGSFHVESYTDLRNAFEIPEDERNLESAKRYVEKYLIEKYFS